jgi:hypothetical protein
MPDTGQLTGILYFRVVLQAVRYQLRRFYTGRSIVRNVTWAVAIAAIVATSACEKTGEGEYQVEKPVVGTETETVETPSVETGTATDTISVPDVDVESEEKEVKVPKVDVETPSEREQEGK